MIATNVADGWEIMFQPAHGLLAGHIAKHLNESHQSPFWYETRIAIAIHDDGKVDFREDNKTYVTEAGAPKDFTLVEMDDEQRFEEAKRRLANAYRKHRWIGLLESMHVDFLYREADVAKPLAELLNEEGERRRKILRKLKRRKAELEAAYQVLRWCDRCSLILCQNRLPEMQRRLEIITMDEVRYEIWQRDDQSVGVDPWPFASDSFDVEAEVRLLRQLAFKDDGALAKAIDNADPELRMWKFCA